MFGLPLVFPNAGNLLSGFASGSSPSTAVATSDNVATSNPSLSHAVGALWNNSGSAPINKYTFGQNTSFADDIEVSIPFQDILRNTLRDHMTEVQAYFGDPANNSQQDHTFGPWAVTGNQNSSNIVFGGRTDLHYAIGTGTLSGQVTVLVARAGTGLRVSAVEANSITVSDLYDFNHDGGFPAEEAATVQAGYGTLGNGGGIFWTYVELNGPLSVFPVDSFN